jgi:uncharacterized protein
VCAKDGYMKNYITDQVRALIGQWSEPRTAPHPIEKAIVRRFYQSVGDVNPLYWDEDVAKNSKYGGLIAPPLFSAFDLPDGTTDPLEGQGADPDYEGFGRLVRRGEGEPASLPPVPIPLHRGLNGGPEHEFYQMPKVGDIISTKTRYRDIYQKHGGSGTMIITETETVSTNQHGAVLQVSRGRSIRYPVDEQSEEQS